MNKNIFMVTVFVFLVSGCSNNRLTLTYITQPQGALLSYSDGTQQLGMSPSTFEYTWDEKYVVNGCLQTKGITATWVSGAKTSSPEILTICGKTGSFTYTLARPNNVEGLEKDMHFAQEVERTRIMQRQAAIAQQQSNLQMIQMFNSMQPKTTTGTIWGPGGSINYRETTQ